MSEKYSRSDIKLIAEELVEELRECEDGAVTSTARLAIKYGYDDMGQYHLSELHDALFREARNNNIALDMYEYDGEIEKPQCYLEFVVRNKEAQIKCPYCGSADTARYIYGYPAFDEEMQEKLNNGKWILGGCCISFSEENGERICNMPTWHCNKCNKDF